MDYLFGQFFEAMSRDDVKAVRDLLASHPNVLKGRGNFYLGMALTGNQQFPVR